MNLSNKAITLIAGVGGLVLFIILIISIAGGAYNRAVGLEENVNNSGSNIQNEEKRRADLFNNLADAVQSYDKFEKSTLTQVIEARKQANSGNVEQAMLTLAVVVEQYPQLQSQKNYKQLMTEFSITENRLAENRKQFNDDVRAYNQFTRGFWTRMWLAISGYEKQDFKYLDLETEENEHRDLFSE
jgi:LemA protein